MADLARLGTPKMIGYRAYLIDSEGHIQGRIDLLYDDDETAKEHAKKLVDGHDVELWQLDRRICEFKAKQLSVAHSRFR